MSLNKATLGSNENDLLRHNRSTLVKLLMKNGASSRAQLAQTMHLTQAAISKTANNLIKEGVIEEILPQKGEKGRRIIPIQLRSDTVQFIGIRLTWKKIFSGVFTISGDCCYYNIEEIIDKPIDFIASRIVSIITDYCKSFPKVVSVGISVPSPYIGPEGRILPVEGKNHWGTFDIRSIREKVGIPVYFKNDAKAGALAEWWFGNHNCKVLFHLLAGEDISSSVIVDGEPFVGAYGIAGEIGHIVVDRAEGTRVNDICSADSFLKNIVATIPQESILHGKKTVSIADIASALTNNDEYCILKVMELGKTIGFALSSAIDLLNPDVIVISDTLTNLGHVLLNSIKETVARETSKYVFEKLSIEFSSVSRQWLENPTHTSPCNSIPIDTPVLGAVAVAVDMFLEDTTKFVQRQR